MSITHPFISGLSDGTDATQVQPSNWNAAHKIDTPTALLTDVGVVLGTDVSGSLTLGGIAASSQLQYMRRKGNISAKTYEFAALNYYSSADYAFSGVSIAQSLTSGITNTITLPYGILGLSGSDTNHYIRINDTVGVSEAVLITGGTATSGVVGTISFVPANSHTSGNWTLETATAGIVEALNVNVCIYLPVGTLNIYATITPPTNSSIIGSGSGAYSNGGTTLQFNSASTKLFNVIKDNVRICNLSILQNASIAAISGNIGIFIAGSGSAVTGGVNNWSYIHDVTVKRFYYGIYNSGDGGVCDINRIFIDSCVSTGLVALGAQGFWSNITIQFSGTQQTTPVSKVDQGHGIYVGTCPSGSCGVPPWFSGIQTFSNYGWGAYADGIEFTLGGAFSYFNNDRAGELYLNASGKVSNFTVEFAGIPTGYAANTTASGIEIGPSSSNLAITNGRINGNKGIGILVNGAGTQFADLEIFNSGQGLVAGSLYGLKINAFNNISVINCRFTNDPVLVTGSSFCNLSHNYFIGGTAALPSLLLTATSTNNSVDQNIIINSNAGVSIQVDAGSTVLDGYNYCSGTITNNGTVSTSSFTNAPFTKSRHFYAASETGANNALITLIPGITLTQGDEVTIKLAHTLQIGANTVSINGTVYNIKSNKVIASNIAAGYGATSYFYGIFNGTSILDMSQ